jgi:hypothetical protein
VTPSGVRGVEAVIDQDLARASLAEKARAGPLLLHNLVFEGDEARDWLVMRASVSNLLERDRRGKTRP